MEEAGPSASSTGRTQRQRSEDESPYRKRLRPNDEILPWKNLYYRFKLSRLPQSGSTGDGGVLAAKEEVERLCRQHSISTLSNCLLNIIRAVGESHSVPQGSSTPLVKDHRLYQLAQDTLARLHPTLLPRPYSLWHLATTIVLLAHDAWDVHSLILLMVQPGSLFSPCVVVEGFYSMALFLLHSSSSPHIGLPIRYHYQVFYAVNLYENNRNRVSEGGGNEGQQTTQEDDLFQPTKEQSDIINHPLQPDNVVKIIAFAGTGKTTTLLQLCQQRPDLKFLLVVYNKSMQDHCYHRVRAFRNGNTIVKTAHALAFKLFGKRFQDKGKLTSNMYSSSINSFLPREGGTGNRFKRVALAKKTLERFLYSADEDITVHHAPAVESVKNQEEKIGASRRQMAVKDAKMIWTEMTKCSSDQRLRMTQDGQVKLWQLSQPRLNRYDVVMVDDGQDMNPAILDVFLRQSCARVIVGDPYQQIYSFRGAVNALESVEATHTFYLAQSFRFGPEVSYAAQCVLEILNKTPHQTLVGGHKRDSFTATDRDMEDLCPSSSGRRTAYLGRTNREVYVKALEMCKKEENASIPMAFAGGVQNFGLETVMDIYNLSLVERKSGTAESLGIKDKLIANFKSVDSLRKFAKDLDDQELLSKIMMYDYSRKETPADIQLLKDRCTGEADEADVTFSTIHKAKGLEWDHVVLLEGSSRLLEILSERKEGNKNKREKEQNTEEDKMKEKEERELLKDEINLLYVSVTRAKTLLTMNPLMLEVLRLCKERMEVLVAGAEVGEGCNCVQCGAPVEGHQPLVTKVVGMELTGTLKLRGGYLCHQCSTQPCRAESPCSGTMVSVVWPHQDHSRSARRQLMMCGQQDHQESSGAAGQN